MTKHDFEIAQDVMRKIMNNHGLGPNDPLRKHLEGEIDRWRRESTDPVDDYDRAMKGII